MKILNIILKVILCLLIATPILGVTGMMGQPTADMYASPEAFAFMQSLLDVGYITWIMAVVFLAAIVLIIMGRTALAALLILPITVNIVAFHAVLEGSLFTSSALMGNVLLLLNLYFLWQNRAQYRSLWAKA